MLELNNVAAPVAAIFSVLTFLRLVVSDFARVDAKVDGGEMRLTVHNPGRRAIFIRMVRLVGTTLAEGKPRPPYGELDYEDTGGHVDHTRTLVPSVGSAEILLHYVDHPSILYAKATLLPASLLHVGREYIVLVRIIS